VFNNTALMEDPDYCKAIERKCLILEAIGEYSQAMNMCEVGLRLYDNEFNFDEESIAVVPNLREIIERCERKKP